MCVIQGSSGSGKIYNAKLYRRIRYHGFWSVKVDGNEISGINADELSEYRRANLGLSSSFIIWYQILQSKKNRDLPVLTEDPLDMEELLDTLGLTEHQDKFPAQLSGGQQQ